MSIENVTRQQGPDIATDFQILEDTVIIPEERANASMKTKKFSIISLFTGCGGLDLGFNGDFTFLGKKYQKRNFEVIWANDVDEASCGTFKNYFKRDIVCGDITKILDRKHATL